MAKAWLGLEDGTAFQGVGFGHAGRAGGELVFHTAATGYQEILSDPSYFGQLITFTHPHIGNHGVNADDMESDRVFVKGMICREVSLVNRHWRCEQQFIDWLNAFHVVGMAEVDTRALTIHLRNHGALRGVIVHEPDASAEQAIRLARQWPSQLEQNLSDRVSTASRYEWHHPSWRTKPVERPGHLVVYDCGVKRQILRLLKDLGYTITVVPYDTSLVTLLALKPDGVVLSNGPGDPRKCIELIALTKLLIPLNIPILGICLGMQILALALGADIIKMKYGHHGANHPVKNLETGSIWITSQNHGYCVAESDLPPEMVVTHRSLFDQSIQGLRHQSLPIIAFQGHPEASPGPHDAMGIFQSFALLVESHRKADDDMLVWSRTW